MKILVTGATGFIGSHVAAALIADGHDVTALIRPGANRWRIAEIEPSLHVLPGDFLSADVAIPPSSFDLCIHLAWYAEPGHYLSSTQNIDFLCRTLRLARQLAEAGCQRLVVAGTCFEYDVSSVALHEQSPTRPRSLYAAAKLSAFTTLEQLCQTVKMDFAWTRFFYLFGPKEDPRRLVPHVINSLLAGQATTLTPGEQVRDFLHVEDVASAVCAVATGALTGAVNIGSGEPVTVAEIAQHTGKIMGRPDLILLGARPYPPGELMHILADNSKLRQQTAWRPRYDLITGLEHTIHWWQTRAADDRAP